MRLKDCSPGIWLVEYLYLGREVPWATIKNGILINDITAEARIRLSIICGRVSPTTNLMNVLTMHSHMVDYFLDHIHLNIGRFVVIEIWHYKNKGGPMLRLPSLIIKL